MTKMTKNLPIVVLGAGGYMGASHVRCLLSLGISAADILGVEPDAERRIAIEKLGVRTFTALAECSAMKPKTAIVATPSPSHREMLEQCAAAGVKNILSEKPLVLHARELEGIDTLGLRIYVGYLINFSPAIERLQTFMVKKGLVVRQVNSVWGNNWAAKGRWIGPNLYEELPHPLVAALCLVGFDRIRAIDRKVLGTSMPSMRPDVSAGDAGNDTSLGLFSVGTDDGDVPVGIFSSFNFFEHRRFLDVVMGTHGSALPEFKATLEFDTKGSGGMFDRLRIIDAGTNAPIAGYENLPFSANKLELQLKAALDAFAGEDPDPRLVSFEQAAMIVRLLDGR